LNWQGCIRTPGRRLHVGATDDGRCSVWHYVDGAPVVLARGRVRAMAELVDVEVVHGSDDDVAHLRRWLRRRLT
jgi:hypothetical protein